MSAYPEKELGEKGLWPSKEDCIRKRKLIQNQQSWQQVQLETQFQWQECKRNIKSMSLN